jgi:teichuronic acid biosynthesis protein TuaE
MNFYITDIHKFLDVFRVLKYSFLLALFIAALEAFTPFRLPTSPYSVYAEFFGRNSVDLVDFENHVQALLRSAPTSFWGNPNTMAVAIVLMLPFFFLTSCVTYRISGVCSILIVVAMAGSRGALIAFIFGLVAYLFIKNAYNILSLFLTVSAIVFFLPNLIDPLKESSSHRISEMARTGEALYIYLLDEDANLGSLGVRQQLISNGMNALWLTNGVGVGGGGSVEIQERLGGVGYKKVSSMHNFWIEVLVDAGIVFFALFMLWYVTVTWRLYRIYKITKDFIYKYHAGALCIAMVIFLIAAVSASSVIYFLPMWLMFGMSTSLIRVYRSQRP